MQKSKGSGKIVAGMRFLVVGGAGFWVAHFLPIKDLGSKIGFDNDVTRMVIMIAIGIVLGLFAAIFGDAQDIVK